VRFDKATALPFGESEGVGENGAVHRSPMIDRRVCRAERVAPFLSPETAASKVQLSTLRQQVRRQVLGRV